MHWVMASLVPETVTALSVELGSISDATNTEAPVICRISLIFDPPFPMSDPHCEAGTIKRILIESREVSDIGQPVSYIKKLETEFTHL